MFWFERLSWAYLLVNQSSILGNSTSGPSCLEHYLLDARIENEAKEVYGDQVIERVVCHAKELVLYFKNSK